MLYAITIVYVNINFICDINCQCEDIGYVRPMCDNNCLCEYKFYMR